MQIGPYTIYNSESVKSGCEYVVFWTVGGRLERAAHIGKRGCFRSMAEAVQSVTNVVKYGTSKV